MKQLIVLSFLLFALMELVLGQKSDSTNVTPKERFDFYRHKRKANNIAGFVLLGSGVAMFVGGAAINASSWGSNNKNKGLWLCYLGGGTTLASVPFFIFAGKNKRKAKLALKQETTFLPLQRITTNYATLQMSISL